MKFSEGLTTLIDKASRAAGTDAALARSLGIQSQILSDWRHGRRTCTPADQALLAHVAGLDPVQVLARATVEAYEGKPKGDALMKALGKALLATGAAVGSAGAAAQGISSMTHNLWTSLVEIYTMYIRSKSVSAIRVMSSA